MTSRPQVHSVERQGGLHAIAEQIPSMGGKEIGETLRQLARNAPANTSIVEVGCWLGAGTAQLALGIRERADGPQISLHCFDRWQANEPEVEKAARRGLHLRVGEDILPYARRTLEPFDVPIEFHKGDLRESRWSSGPISVYVDDASKTPKLFFHALRTFGPSWVPGETVIVLMDYDIWQKTGDERHTCQKQFIERHAKSFEPVMQFDQAVFRYVRPIEFEEAVSKLEPPDRIRRAPRPRLNVGGQADLLRALDFAEAEVRSLAARVRMREEEIRQLRASTSWRITAPLRSAVDQVLRVIGSAQRGR